MDYALTWVPVTLLPVLPVPHSLIFDSRESHATRLWKYIDTQSREARYSLGSALATNAPSTQTNICQLQRPYLWSALRSALVGSEHPVEKIYAMETAPYYFMDISPFYPCLLGDEFPLKCSR